MMRHTPRTFVGTTSFRVVATTGADAARLIAAVSALRTGARASVHVVGRDVTVTTDHPLDRADVVRAIESAGFTVSE